MLIDALIMTGSMALASYIRPVINSWAFIKELPVDSVLPGLLYVLFPATTVFIFSAFTLYDGKKFLRAADEFSNLTLAFLIVTISLAGVLYFSYRNVSRALFLLIILFAFWGFVLWRVLVRLYFYWRREHVEDAAQRVLVVGAGSLGQKVRDQVSRHSLENLCFVGFVDDENQSCIESVTILGEINDIARLVQDYDVTDVMIALPHSAYQNMSRIVTLLEGVPVRIWVALDFFDLALYKLEISQIADIPLIDLRAPALSEFQLQVKRAFDLTLASLGLIAFLPLMGICALLIWLEDRGPILFHQKRVGEGGRLFTMYKFRTMRPDAEKMRALVERTDEMGNLIHKTPNDPRITRVGKFLRRTSLDELPQLFNVLNGTMSLVGPRPELPYLVEKYQPWQRKRFAVPPGMTGWWQVNGRSDKPMHLNTQDDLYYIQNYSVFLDIQILFMTIWVVLLGKGSY